jgi:hypothetical protein
MLTGLLCVALAIVLALLATLHRRVDQLPGRVRFLIAEERAKALTELQEAVAGRVAGATAALRVYENDIAQHLRDEVVATELRARVAERRSTDVASVLEGATALVRELRALLDRLQPLAVPAAEDERRTIEMTRPAHNLAEASETDDPPDEPTKVAPRRTSHVAAIAPQSRRGNEGAS